MSRLLAHPFWSDARHYQIAALTTLLIFNFGWLDFGAQPFNSACAIAAALATQVVCSRFYDLPQIDLRSPLITGLSLSLLLRADDGVALRARRRDRRSARNSSSASTASTSGIPPASPSWCCCSRRTASGFRPAQWGSAVWFAALLAFFAILVLHAARRSDMAIFFLACHGALLLARAWWLGDPLAIPLHQLQSGSLLIFAFFMISDPRTSPDSRLGRFIFALSVALLRALPRLLHADAAGALRGADRALPAHPSDRPDTAGGTVRLDPPGLARSIPMTQIASRLKTTVAVAASRAARRARRAGRRLLRLLRRQGGFQAVQQILQGRAGARRQHHRHHHGERLRGRAEGIRASSFRCRPSSSASRSAWST